MANGAFALSCTILLVGCIDDLPAPETTPDAFDRAVMDVLADYRSFARINRAPYSSTLGQFKINVFTSNANRDYKRIHPDTSRSNVELPPGTIIVREVLGSAGEVTKLTLMTKGEPGYDPRIGDWWFGVTDPQGVPLTSNGRLQLGRLEECHGCHVPRAEDDYLFGVLSSDQ
jgi:hypothetical protein